MSHALYVCNLPPHITLEELVIYFQSDKSGGGDIDYDACKLDNGKATVVFEEAKCVENVLQRQHEIAGSQIQISDTPFRVKPVPKKRKSVPKKEQIQGNDEKAYLGEVRTVIVSGLCPETTDETLKMFFEYKKRSGGGDIENIDRSKPDIAYITYVCAKVASNVLRHDKLELDGYLLQLKEKQPELHLPLDRKKLYVTNIDPKTTKDSLRNYIELRTKKEVYDLVFGENGNVLVTLNEEPDMKQVAKYKKPLEGAMLRITNPPICNTVLVTGLSKNTTKQAIEMYFENEKNGGGKIYGDVIYQKDEGVAVVSFCDPDVIHTLCAKKHTLNDSMLSVHRHYQFIKTVTEESAKIIELNEDVAVYIGQYRQDEFRHLFGIELQKILKENAKELTLPCGTKKEVVIKIQEYVDQFKSMELPFCKKLLEKSEKLLNDLVESVDQKNCAVILEAKQLRIKIIGSKVDVGGNCENLKNAVAEMERNLNVHTEQVDMPGQKLALFLLHGIGDQLKTKFRGVDVKIEPQNGTVTIKEPENQVGSAARFVLQKGAQISEDTIDISEIQKDFLKSGGLDTLNNGIKSSGLKGIVLLGGPNAKKAKLLVFDATTIVNIRSYVNNNLFEEIFHLDEESLPLLKSNKWQEFNKDASANSSVKIFAGAGGSAAEVTLIGKKSDVKQIYKKLEEFMKRNTIVKENLPFGEGLSKYLAQFCKKDLENIEMKLEEQQVKIRREDEQTMSVEGTREGVKEAREQIEKIVLGIATGKVCIEQPRMQKYFENGEGQIFLQGVQFSEKCVIRLTKNDERNSPPILSSRSNPGVPISKLLCSYETREKVSLKVYQANITTHRCDVIVNAANGDLKHIGGVAKCILDAGGREIQDECDAFVNAEGRLYYGDFFNGSPGRLPCKRLIHAVGPRWSDGKPDEIRKRLKVTVQKVLEEAKGYQSIAFPAIGSGVFGVPKDVCATVMIEAAQEFSKNRDYSTLKEIHFVNNDDATGQVFLKKFRDKFGRSPSFTDNTTKGVRSKPKASGVRFQAKTNKKNEPRIAPEVFPRPQDDNSILTKTNMTISVTVGDLSTHKADVLVNTTGKELNLESNPCSKALSNEAGPSLQAECNKIGGLKVGQVAVTQSGNLLCDEVYHVTCVQWNGGAGEKVLRSIIKNCLKKANENEKKSIAFPAIGTGVLGFPHDVAAKVFFEETKQFAKKFPNSNVKSVCFVVYSQDTNSIEAFKNELKKQPEWSTIEPTPSGAGAADEDEWTKRRKSTRTSSSEKMDWEDGEDSVMCIQVDEDREIEIVKGDITKETTDVIAHLTNPQLSMLGGVANALAKEGGKDIERECKANAPATMYETVLTTAGRLHAAYVAHMVASSNPTPNDVEKCIHNCLQEISKEECQSISFPAVGTGHLKQDPEKAATTIVTSILHALQANHGSVKTVRIVLRDDDLVTAFQAAVKQLNQEEEPGMLRKFLNFFWKSDEATAVPAVVKPKSVVNARKLFVEIYAKDEATVGAAKRAIEKIMESHKKKEKLEDATISKLSKLQVAEIENLCEVNGVKVTIQKELDRIVIVGHSEDVSKTMTDIFSILKKIGEAEKEIEKAKLNAEFAEIVSQGVQWVCIHPTNGNQVEYDKHENTLIEKAYNKKEKSVLFSLNNEKYEIVFDKMKEKNLKTGVEVQVIRKDLKATDVSVPEYWDPQPCDANGKEEKVHLVTLNPNDPKHQEEHKKVTDCFQKTGGQAGRILQIQRVQNPSLFKQYVIKKRSLDEKNGSNSEQLLFHGTSSGILDKINRNGLNRSYAGNTNGVAFGKGVYFARDASMSASYAHPDTTGKRYMYLTRVAVGQYTIGSSSMIVPPSKAGNSSDSFDCVVNNMSNPTIFVLFYDTQYYPEYLITFT